LTSKLPSVIVLNNNHKYREKNHRIYIVFRLFFRTVLEQK
jgi:hypothetical protein